MGKKVQVNPRGSRPLWLSPSYTEKDWDDAFDGCEDWDTAINIVEDRIKGRWLDVVDELLRVPHSGFAILALDFIVIEALWSFRNGRAAPNRLGNRITRTPSLVRGLH